NVTLTGIDIVPLSASRHEPALRAALAIAAVAAALSMLPAATWGAESGSATAVPATGGAAAGGASAGGAGGAGGRGGAGLWRGGVAGRAWARRPARPHRPSGSRWATHSCRASGRRPLRLDPQAPAGGTRPRACLGAH